MSAVDKIVGKLDGAKRSGDSWEAKCPAHDDNNPSLSVKARDQGDPGAVVKCHAQCPTEAVMSAIGLTLADLFDKPAERTTRRHIDTVYPYTDEAGKVLFEVVRYNPKDFRQRRVLDNGKHEYKLGDVRRVLYRLPEVVSAIAKGEPVYVVEGEKDADALANAGYVATCPPMGAGKWSKVPDAAEVLRGAEVVIVIDNDAAGIAHGQEVAASLIGVADNLTVTRAAIGKDAADHLGAGKAVEELEIVASDSKELIDIGNGEELTPWIESKQADNNPSEDDGAVVYVEPVDWETLFAGDTDHEWLVEDVWPLGRQLHIFAAKKTGKSLLMLWIAANLAYGRDPFTGRRQDPQRITYLDYEMTEDDIRERLEEMEFTPSQLANLRYYLHPPIPPLDTPAGGAALLALAKRDESVAVVLDTVSRVVEGEENSNDTFRNFYRHTGMELKRAGIGLARLDHEGHDGGRSRGASAKADDVDVVWRLTKSDDGLTLTRTVARMSWIAERVDIQMKTEPLLFVRTDDSWPAGTRDKAAELDKLGLPTDATRRAAVDALKAAGIIPGKTTVISKAIAYRKHNASILELEEVA